VALAAGFVVGVKWTLEMGMSEWCLDAWHDSCRGAPDEGLACVSVGSHETSRLRGGPWFNCPRFCRSAYRNHYLSDDAVNGIGFRVVCLPKGPSFHS